MTINLKTYAHVILLFHFLHLFPRSHIFAHLLVFSMHRHWASTEQGGGAKIVIGGNKLLNIF